MDLVNHLQQQEVKWEWWINGLAGIAQLLTTLTILRSFHDKNRKKINYYLCICSLIYTSYSNMTTSISSIRLMSARQSRLGCDSQLNRHNLKIHIEIIEWCKLTLDENTWGNLGYVKINDNWWKQNTSWVHGNANKRIHNNPKTRSGQISVSHIFLVKKIYPWLIRRRRLGHL